MSEIFPTRRSSMSDLGIRVILASPSARSSRSVGFCSHHSGFDPAVARGDDDGLISDGDAIRRIENRPDHFSTIVLRGQPRQVRPDGSGSPARNRVAASASETFGIEENGLPTLGVARMFQCKAT